jgi:hypothetical protein
LKNKYNEKTTKKDKSYFNLIASEAEKKKEKTN